MINIKGVNGNLVIVFGQGEYSTYEQHLQQKLVDNQDLFKGSKVLFRGDGLANLTHEELANLQKLCLDYGMVLNNTSTSVEKGNNKDLFIYRNIRSGQRVRSEGSVVIWGDVHESAEIVAARDIIVLGKLEGIAHAGCYGNKESIVFALTLAPGQIRIADQLSRSPSNYQKKYLPEIAYLDGETICISQYNSKENLARLDII